MIGKLLDENHDIVLGSNGFETVSDADNVYQHVLTNLKAFKGDWFLNVNSGVAYFQEIFTKPALLGVIESELKVTILNTPQVARLTLFTLDFDKNTRQLIVTFNAKTTYNESIGGIINV